MATVPLLDYEAASPEAQAVFDDIEGILRGVLTKAWDQLQTRGNAWT